MTTIPSAWTASPNSKHPKMMAIGDSLIKGIKSMNIDGARPRKELCNLVARAIRHTNVIVPDYRGGVLPVDLKEELRTRTPFVITELLSRKKEIFSRVRQNALSWIEEAMNPAATASRKLSQEPVRKMGNGPTVFQKQSAWTNRWGQVTSTFSIRNKLITL